MPYLSDTPTSASGGMSTAENALMRGQRTYARDIIENQTRNLNQAQVQGQQAASSVASMGGNPFVAQRQAGRQVIQQQGQIRAQASDAIAQRTRELQAQRDREREAEQNRGRQMLGSMLQTAGGVASMIPGIGSAIGGAAGAVGGMVGGQPQQGGGGIGGAIGGLMGAFGGGQPQQASPAPTGATAASLMGAQPQPMMQGAGAAAVSQARRPGPIPGTFMADDGVNLEIPGLGRTRSLAVGPDWLAEEQRRMRAAGQYQRPPVPQFPGAGERL